MEVKGQGSRIRWLLLWDHNAGLICVMRRKKEQKKDCVGRVSDSEKGLGSWWGEETQSRDFLLEALDMGQKWLTLVSTLAVHTHGWEAAWSLLFWYLHSSNIYRGTMSVLLGLIFTYLHHLPPLHVTFSNPSTDSFNIPCLFLPHFSSLSISTNNGSI